MALVSLAALSPGDLALVGPWFDDAETRRWLGGRDWPAQTLRLADPAAGRYALKAVRGEAVVGLLDIEAYEDGEASFALVVAPAARRTGIGDAMIRAMCAAPFLATRTGFFAGVELENRASRGLLLKAGFVYRDGPDGDGFVYYEKRTGD